MSLYAFFLLYIPADTVINYCQSQFYAPKTTAVVELCEESVWHEVSPEAYLLNK